MATYLNHVAIAADRNGTTSHTVTPSSGTVVAGTAFTPTEGRLLVCVVEGSVTSSTPSGWTLPTGGSAINYTGLYVWYRTAAGSDSFTTTHNGSNYPVIFHFFEFAAGSTFISSAAASDVYYAGGAGPSLTGLSGTLWVAAAMGQSQASDFEARTITWSAGTELVDVRVLNAEYTDGYLYSLTHVADYESSTWSASATVVPGNPPSVERLVFAISVSTGATTVTSTLSTNWNVDTTQISLRAAGTPTSVTAAVTAINPAVPSGAQSGDLSVLTVWAKPYNTTIGTPSGWTKIAEATNGTTAAGTDTGSTKVAVFVQESASVGAIGNLSLTSANSAGAVINTYSKDSSQSWDYSQFTSGGDSTNGSNYSATGEAGIDVAAGDWVLQGTAVNGDVGTQSAQAIAGMSGATRGTYVVRQSADVTTGTDSHGEIGDIPITAGSSTAAPTFTYTNGSSGSGTTIWLRLRQVPGTTSVSNTLETGWHVLKTIVDDLSTSWNVQEQLSQVTVSRSTSWHAYSQVIASRSTPWNVRAFVNAARSMVWNANQSISTSRSTSWRVLASISNSRSTLWRTASYVLAARSTSWTVSGPVTATRSTAWRVVGRIQASKTTSWNVNVVAIKAISTPWNVLAQTSATRSSTWNVRSSITSNRSTSWNTLILATNSRSSLWNVTALVASQRSSTWNTQAYATSIRSTSWHVVGRAVSAKSTTWNVNISVLQQRSNLWNVRKQLANATSTNWHVYKTIGQTRTTSWNVAEAVTLVTKSISTLWNVDGLLTSVSRELGTTWRVVGRIVSNRNTLWVVQKTISGSRSTSWNVNKFVSDDFVTSWNVVGRVLGSRSTLWHVSKFVASERSTTWIIHKFVSGNRSTTWHTNGRLSNSKMTSWHVYKRLSSTRSYLWNVRTSLSRPISTIWAVRKFASQNLSNFWNVQTIVENDLVVLWKILPSGSHFWLWDGTTLIPVILEGEWDGSTLQPLAPWADEVVN